MNASTSTVSEAVAALCPACALCCNGVLFRDIVLQPAERAANLRSLNVPLQSKGRNLALPQPCSCLHANLCRIYQDRPNRCRSFECGLLKRVQAGDLSEAKARQRIRSALRRVTKVQELLRKLGNQDESKPLSRRYAQLMSTPIDLAADGRLSRLRTALARQMDHLMQLLHRNFLQ